MITREIMAAELGAALKAIDDLKHARPGCQSAREQCAAPVERTIKIVLDVMGYELDEHGNPKDVFTERIKQGIANIAKHAPQEPPAPEPETPPAQPAPEPAPQPEPETPPAPGETADKPVD